MRIKTLAPLLLAAVTACGIPISESEPLVFVAPLEGEWTLETDANTTCRVTFAPDTTCDSLCRAALSRHRS